MNRRLWILGLAVLLALFLLRCQPYTERSLPEPAIKAQFAQQPEFVPGRIVVKRQAGVSAHVFEGLGVRVIDRIPELDVDILETDLLTASAVSKLAAQPGIAWAEPDYIARAFETPQDPYLDNQWHFDNIHAYAGWNVTTGSSDVVVAVVDTGIDMDHPDLASKIVSPYDVVNGDEVPDDDHGHGTHVSGLIGAITDNGRGVAGMSWGTRILPCKALNANGAGSYSEITRCMTWAVAKGANVINLSLGGVASSNLLDEAINEARSNNVVIVAAAGNSGNSYPQYPAAHSGVIGVAATDKSNRRASFSSFGPYVSVSAPGTRIFSTCNQGQYCYLSGTSMSTPIVSGLAALLYSYPNPIAVEIRDTIEDTTQPLQDSGMGTGLIDVYAALSSQGAQPTATPGGPTATPLPTSPPQPTMQPPSGNDARTIFLINNYRESLGLKRLYTDQRLIQASRGHSADMAANGFCGHFGSDGSNPWGRGKEAGYDHVGGEIVACGYLTPEDAVEAWQRSPGHDDIMRGNYSDVGCGVIERRYTCMFGSDPRNPEPTPIAPGPTVTPVTPTVTPVTPTVTPTVTPVMPTVTPSLGEFDYCMGFDDNLDGPDDGVVIECP